MTDDPIRRMLEEAWDAGAAHHTEQPDHSQRMADIDAILAARMSSGTISTDVSALTGTGVDSEPHPIDSAMARSIREMRND
jgi:hypothetical protein